jgi:iron complex outermembrane receptor protein
LNLALFRVDTRDEIVTNTSSGGRTDFKNAARTRREGLEASLQARLAEEWEASIVYTALDARFTEPFTSGSPPAVIPAGRRLPGVPRSSAFAELAWRSGGAHAALEMRYVGRVPVNEANSDFAPSYLVTNLRVGFEHRVGAWKVREFVRVDNVDDRPYAGSVIVAEARGRYFEPAPGRNFMAGIEVSRAF